MMRIFKTLAIAFSLAFTSMMISCGGDDDDTIVVGTDATVGFSSAIASVSESGSAITVSVTYPELANALSLKATVSGTAVYGTDYTTSPAVVASEVTFDAAAGSTTATVTLSPVDNGEVDGNRTVVFSLQSASGIKLGNNPTFTVTILDDDVAQEPGVTAIFEDFESFGDPGSGVDYENAGWLNFPEAGARLWRLRTFDGNQYVEFSAFNSNDASNIGWMVLPKIDFDNLATKEMSFRNQIRFGDTNTELALLHSADFDGTTSGISSATWTPLNFTASTTNNQWVGSGTIDLSSFSGNGYLAFRYTGDGTNEDNDATYAIDDIIVGDADLPTISASMPSLSFGQMATGTTADLTYTVSATNLTADILLGTGGAFSISLDGSTFSGMQTIPMADAMAGGVTVTVRFSASTGTNGTKTGSISHTSGSASATVDLTGEETGNVAGALSIEDGFEGCTARFGVPGGWIEAVVPGSKTDRGWGCRDDKARSGSYAVRASAFGGSAGEDNTYLIYETQINFDDQTGETMKFWATSEFDGPGSLDVVYSNDYAGSGDPSLATWNKITITLPAGGSDTYTEVTADLSSITGSAYIAFHYYGASNSSSISWDLDDMTITSN